MRDASSGEQNHTVHCFIILLRTTLHRHVHPPHTQDFLLLRNGNPFCSFFYDPFPQSWAKYQVLGFVNWHALISALRLSNLNGKPCHSWCQQACIWHLPVPITHLKIWRLQSCWESDGLLGLLPVNCTPLSGAAFLCTVPTAWEDLMIWTLPITFPSQQVPTPTSIPTANCWYPP